MTREEAINHLKTVAKSAIDSGYDSAIVDAVDMAREALEKEPCEDAISRQAALDTFGLSEKSRKYGGDHSGYDTIMLYEVQDALEALPPVQPKTGHWSRVRDKAGHLVWECDCGWQQRFATNFCPDCGTKMIESHDSEEQA